ncbi:MAG: DUF3048 domain-containing protein [Candidatus Magasanikbacteria bacterium]
MLSKRYFAYIIGALLSVSALMLGYILYNYFFSQTVWKNSILPEPEKEYIYFSALTGEGVETEAQIWPRAVAVMIDNHPVAYPQSGLDQASIVYEVPVEGGFTRFMAIYSASDLAVEKVGPVRSARPYFLDWLAEYGDGVYMHSGGSAEALDLIKERKIFDTNEFWWGEYYWRDDHANAPHNLFTKSENWQKIIADYGAKHTGQPWSGWAYNDEILPASTTQGVRAFSIPYRVGYSVAWTWDSANKYFARTVSDASSKEQLDIHAQNVIVQFVSVRSLDEVDRKKITTVGGGEARVWRDGVMARGTWKKESVSARTRFYDSAGTEISLRPGVIWVQIVPKEITLEVSR